jgi:hypothetical protein
MSEYPIPHGGQLLFLHPEEMQPEGEIQICHRADEQNALKIVSLPPIKVQTKPAHLRKPGEKNQPMRKTHLT